MLILNAVSVIFLLVLVPLVLGVFVARLFKFETITLTNCFCIGTFFQWGLFQLVSVPFILLRSSFTALVWAISILYLVLAAFTFLMKDKIRPSWNIKFNGVLEKILFACLIVVFLLALYFLVVYQHIDDDDSRFVVNIVDTIRTNSMLLTNPATGEAIPVWEGELLRDVASPWAIFQAYVSYLSGIHGTIFAHSVQPVALFLLLFAVQWEISKVFVGEKLIDRCLFCLFIWVLLWFGNYNGWTAEAFTLYRIWQGKAVVAGIGIPYMIGLLISYYQEEKKQLLFALLICNFAMCLLTNMGILFGCFLVGVFGLVYGIAKRKWKTSLFLWLTPVPNVVYGVFSLLL